MPELDDDKVDAPRARQRRLHTISGAALLGAFLVLHLFTQASALGGAALYDRIAGAIGRSYVRPILELLVLVPLAFHVVSGLRRLANKSAPEADRARYGSPRLWQMQRISALVVLIFVLVHVGELRIARLAFGLSQSALYSTMTAHLSTTWASLPWVALLYLVGIGATTFHFANGLHAAIATWSVTEAVPRNRVRIATAALGALLFVLGAATVVALATGGRLLGSAHDDALPCGSAVPSTPPEPASPPPPGLRPPR